MVPFETTKIAVLAFKFRKSSQPVVFAFERETDDPACTLTCTERGDDVVRLDEVQVDGLARLGDLVVFNAHRAVIARGGGADQPVTGVELARGRGEHLVGRDDRHDARSSGIIDFHRSTHDDHLMAERESGLGQRLAHPAGRGVREVAHRVEVLAGRSRGDQNSSHNSSPPSTQRTQRRKEIQTTDHKTDLASALTSPCSLCPLW